MRTVGVLKKKQKAGSEGKEGNITQKSRRLVPKEGGNAAPWLRSLQTLARQVS